MTLTSESTTATLAAKLDALLAAAVAAGDVPGVTLAVATADEVVYSGAAGRRRCDDPTPITPDTLVWLLSQTKVLTVVVALQFVEAGLIGLDDPVDTLLPELASVPVLDGFEPDGTPRTRPATTRVTLRHLLNHTAGGGYPFFNADVRDAQAALNIPPILASLRETLFRTPLLHEPGTAFEYGTNIDLLGLVLEKVGGADLETLVRTRVIDPLGLQDTTAAPSAEQRTRVASAHSRGKDGSFTPIPLESAADPEFFAGGQYLYGTVVDYARLLQALLRGGELDGIRILSAEHARAGFESQIGDLKWHAITTAHPATTNDVDLLHGGDGSWGWFGVINTEPTPGRSAGSSFWAGLANSYWWVDPSRGVVGALATQILPFADPRVLALTEQVEKAVGEWLAAR